MNSFTAYFILAVILPPLAKILKKFENIVLLFIKRSHEINRFKTGIIDIEDLYRLTPREFEEWCRDFLEKSGYSDVQVTPVGPDGGKDIVCREGEKTVYVECKRYSQSPASPFKVHIDIIKKLVGAMIHDGVYKGIIITTGKVTKDARLYAYSLPHPYVIGIIDGRMLVEKCNELKLYTYPDYANNFE